MGAGMRQSELRGRSVAASSAACGMLSSPHQRPPPQPHRAAEQSAARAPDTIVFSFTTTNLVKNSETEQNFQEGVAKSGES